MLATAPLITRAASTLATTKFTIPSLHSSTSVPHAPCAPLPQEHDHPDARRRVASARRRTTATTTTTTTTTATTTTTTAMTSADSGRRHTRKCAWTHCGEQQYCPHTQQQSPQASPPHMQQRSPVYGFICRIFACLKLRRRPSRCGSRPIANPAGGRAPRGTPMCTSARPAP